MIYWKIPRGGGTSSDVIWGDFHVEAHFPKMLGLKLSVIAEPTQCEIFDHNLLLEYGN
jgi:hypothetical protein